MHFKDFDCQFKADGDDSGSRTANSSPTLPLSPVNPTAMGTWWPRRFRQDNQGMAGQRQYTARVVWASHG